MNTPHPSTERTLLIVKPDGSEAIATERRGTASDAESMGRDAGDELKRRGGPGFLST